jgi:TRAP-type C4-dicarboxylate transport system permease small subunit
MGSDPIFVSMNLVMKSLERALALAFIFAVVLNFANVIGRYVVGRTIDGADEVQIYIMVAMAFLGAAAVAWRRDHLRMDVLARRVPPLARTVLQVLEVALIVVLAAFVLWQSAGYTWQMLTLGRVSDGAGIPMWIPHSAVAIGFGLMALVAVVQLFRRP